MRAIQPWRDRRSGTARIVPPPSSPAPVRPAPEANPYSDPVPDARTDAHPEPEASGRGLRDVDPSPKRRWTPILLAFVGLFAASTAALAWIRHERVPVTGDEPHYLVSALALGKFHSLNVAEAYRYAAGRNLFYDWHYHLGESIASFGQVVVGSRGTFAYHEIGLPLLLAPAATFGRLGPIELTSIAILTALTVGLGCLVGAVSGSTSRRRIAVVGLFAAPVLLLASTQIYPDLLSGLVVAIALMVIALVEVTGSVDARLLVVLGISLGFLPWLHLKNVGVVALVTLAAVLVALRRHLPLRRLLWAVTPMVLLLFALGAYNDYAFGRLSGPSGETSVFGLDSVTRFVGLLIDRRQGILVALPVVLLGIAGLVVSRRRLPISTTAGALVVLAVIGLNATHPNSYGGYSFAGRFWWEAAPTLLAFGGIYLLELARTRPARARVVVAIVAALYVLEAIPILNGHHVYFTTALAPGAPYRGWWSPVDGLFPVFGNLGRAWSGADLWWQLVVGLVVGIGTTVFLVRSVRSPSRGAAISMHDASAGEPATGPAPSTTGSIPG
jgi:hypothetical protein